MSNGKYDQPLNVVKRLRYFDGQFLKDDDFIEEQQFHIDRQNRHQRALHVAGIVEGLGVAKNNDNLGITVSPGTAVDSVGRSIILLEQPPPISVPQGVDAAATMYVELKFNETGSDPADPNKDGSPNTRFDQEPAIVISSARNSDALLLATLTILMAATPRTIDSISTASCMYSGVRLPGPQGTGGANSAIGAALALRTRSDGQGAELSGGLSVAGQLISSAVGIGTTTPNQALVDNGTGKVGIGLNDPNQSAALAVNGQVGIGYPSLTAGVLANSLAVLGRVGI